MTPLFDFIEVFMTNQDLKQRIIGLIEPIIKDNFMELVDIDLINTDYLRIIIDKQGGVSLDDCTFISKSVNILLGASGYNFSLEVSSPGIDRPLKKIEDFKKFIGKKVKIVTNEPVNSMNFLEGNIDKILNDTIAIDTNAGIVEVDFNNVKKANLAGEIKI
ncbi:MAG: ribosome maturation factor RimP [Candidatus Goldbacteria bacterium]|nr:ribosome maturation factor RimP [Candidatus Goldiibacteriota bacterium]